VWRRSFCPKHTPDTTMPNCARWSERSRGYKESHVQPHTLATESKNIKRQPRREEMRSEYEFDYSKAVRGKYYRRLLKEGANVVVLEPDVARAFRGSAAVNDALRSLLQVSESTRRLINSTRGARKRAG
jgi:hypothetical protein